MPLASTAGDGASPRRCSSPAAATWPREVVFQEVGGFDADYFAYFEDVDFGWRANLAGSAVQTSGAMVAPSRRGERRAASIRSIAASCSR
ncbi:MAG: hypothetical protein U0166_13715 [Acidobacteriota bacterium]